MKVSTRRSAETTGVSGRRELNQTRLRRSAARRVTSKTRLGRAVGVSIDREQNTVPAHEQHSTNNSLRDVILGGQDGLVNMLGIALGVVAAGGPTHVLVVTGIAGH